MKKALFLCCSLLFLLLTGARASSANVTFVSERGVPFQLVFDGRPLTPGSTQQLRIDRLAPGPHWAEFRIPTPYGRAVRYRTRIFLESGRETSFVLLARSGYPPALRKVAVVPIRYGPGYPGGGYNSGYGQNNYPGNGRLNDGGYGAGYDNQASPVPVPNGAYDNDGGYSNGNDGGYAAPGNAPYPTEENDGGPYRVMTTADVDALVQFLRSKPLDSNKLPVARQALDESLIQARDLRRLLQAFDSEKSRLDLARYAYPRVADQQNFDQTYEAFEYESSVQELRRFSQQQRR